MSERDLFLRLADRIRSIAGPTTWANTPGFDVRQMRVIVRSRIWSGQTQTGTKATTDLEITPRPHVKGMAGDPMLVVGPITPAYPGPPAGGYTPAQLVPGDAESKDWNYIIIGPDGVERPYKLMQLDTSRPLRYMLNLTSLDRRVPY